ncbi:MAG: hypothetical protein HUJ68_10525 [Clostridia bacterium]|nr:hypothetical protein [Clostridia bacterium]
MYLPLFFIVTVSNYNSRINDVGMLEIEYTQNKHKLITYIKDLAYDCLTVMIMTGVHLIICKLLYTLSFNAAVTIYDYIIHTIISIVFFSSIAYIVCALSFSKSIAIFVCSMIWIYFMVNIDSTSLINPFYYVGDPNSSAVHMYGQSMISLVLIIVTGYIRLQRPFFFKQ